MKLFVWQRIRYATDSYHQEGGVIAFAADEARARELAEKNGAKFGEKENPDIVCETDRESEDLIIFPDAGCC